MISLDVKSEAKGTSSSPLSLQTPSDEPVVSFSDLLRGVSDKKDGKIVQNGSLLLALGSDEKDTKNSKDGMKVDTLLTLLKTEETSDILVDDEVLELNPKLAELLNPKELKNLVSDAKNYLKQKIEASDDYKLAQVKELPKTIKGLVSMAKKLNIDVSKISIEEVEVKQPLENMIKVKPNKMKQVLQEKDTPSSKPTELKDSPIKQILQDTNVEADVDVRDLKPKEIKTEAKVEVKSEIKTEVKVELKPEIKTEVKAEVKLEAKTEIKSVLKPETKTEVKPEIKLDTTPKEVLSNEKVSQNTSQLKSMPLFKAQAESTSTEQIVQVKTNVAPLIVNNKTAKDKSDETLKLLLRGEKPSMSSNLTADFSVATAKVIAPSAVTDVKKSLDQLLHGEDLSDKDTNLSSIETLSTHKADSFEVKLNEAKQMIKYLSNDVKTAIEDYKSPFTRIKVQLNPQKLGEVDLTIVQRGKNLHVNISSNTTAVSALAANVNELKVQLANNGINNASLNFNNNSQDNAQNASQQQRNPQQEKQAEQEYNFFEKEETNEEVLSSLEIVVPQYG